MTIRAFNLPWFIFAAIALALILLLWKYYHKASYEKRRNVMLGLTWTVVIYLILYRVFLAFDPGYNFVFWSELPLQPCNICCIFAVFAVAYDSKILKAFCFYVGILAPIMALVMVESAFTDVPVFSARSIGYYGFHFLVIVESVSFATLHLFEPEYSYIKNVTGFFALLLIPIHIINTILRATVYPKASYFWTYGNEENAILVKLKELIPINLVYMLPLAIVFAIYCVAVTAVSKLIFHYSNDINEHDETNIVTAITGDTEHFDDIEE